MKFVFFSRLLCVAALGISGAPVWSADTPAAPNPNAVLMTYQLALDQLAGGGPGATTAARVILEDGVRRYGPQNDLNLLLAYLYQREGKNDKALERVTAPGTASPLAAAFATQLRGATPVPVVPVTPVAPETNIVPVAAKAPAASLAQGDARLAKLENAMMEMVNAERTKAGLGELKWDDNLANVARAHSAEMRDKNYFAHESPTPGLTTHADRYRAAGHQMPRVLAENIFRSWGSPRQLGLDEIKEGHASLMKSPGHRANILYPEVTRIGIGIAVNARGDLWLTQMFMRP
jgi:uncharacterized protein YkwD